LAAGVFSSSLFLLPPWPAMLFGGRLLLAGVIFFLPEYRGHQNQKGWRGVGHGRLADTVSGRGVVGGFLFTG
jgi:hypothetical protein